MKKTTSILIITMLMTSTLLATTIPAQECNDNQPPKIEITKPEAKSLYMFDKKIMNLSNSNIISNILSNQTRIFGVITIEANATDDNKVEKVEFYIDDELKETVNETPYQYKWSWKEFESNQKYNIKVKAYDEEGLNSTDNITVNRHRSILLYAAAATGVGYTGLKTTKNILQGKQEETPEENETEKQTPKAIINAPGEKKSNTEITFDASESSDIDGEITSYQWEFGTGDTAKGKTVTYTFKKPGIYTVYLTVTDDSGLTDTAYTSVAIKQKEVNKNKETNSDIPILIIIGLLCVIAAAVAIVFYRKKLKK
ncbi:MAG: PKD domain-containing protein [Candidatus Thermoplasmatota archaeon]